MALVFLEGFDHIGTSEVGTKLWSWSINSGGIASSGRFGTGRFLQLNNEGGLGVQVERPLGVNYSEIYYGYAFRFGAWNTNNYVAVTDSGSEQFKVRITGSGQLETLRGSTILHTYPLVLATSAWYYIEVYLLVANSPNGAYKVRLNGVEILNYSGIDTQETANAQINGFRVKASTNNDVRVDDMYLCDTTGGAPHNTFLGDIRIETLFPSGNGNSSQFVGNDGNSTDNYLLVDEVDPDEDTTYVESATVSNKDTYACGNLATATGTVYAVNPILYAKKTDAGSRSVASVARLSGGTEADSSNVSLSSSYTFIGDIRTTKPGGGTWSISDVNDAEFGVKVTV